MRWKLRLHRQKPPPPTLPVHGDDDSEYSSSDELQVLVDKSVGPCDSRQGCTPEEWLNDYTEHVARHYITSQNRPWHKQPRYAGLLWSTIVSVSVLLLLAAFSGYWILQLLLIRHAAYSHSVTALPIIPDGKHIEHLVQPFNPISATTPETATQYHLLGRNTARAEQIQAVQHELDRRFTTINAPVSTMTCTWSSEQEDRYRDLPSQGPYLFAMNLFNNQAVISSLVKTLLQLSEFLGPDNVLVSVFENGSSDNTTLALAHTAAALSAANVAHEILSDPRKTDWKYVDRIAQLALYRNYVLRPVNSTLPPRQSSTNATSSGRSFEHVVFINDVFLCPKDVLELVYQRTTQHAHATCAMDWRKAKPWLGKKFGFGNNIKFYDNWVSRTLSGNLFRARVDLLTEFRDGVAELLQGAPDEPTHRRFRHGLPMPVYSCWNGVIALPAAPFQTTVNSASNHSGTPSRTAYSSSKRASTFEPVSFRSTLNTAESCPGASECKILASDFWSRGLNRWLVIPTVHVTYEREVYDHPSLVSITERGRASANSSTSAELVDWSALRPPETVACYPWFRGTKIELEEMRAAPF